MLLLVVQAELYDVRQVGVVGFRCHEVQQCVVDAGQRGPGQPAHARTDIVGDDRAQSGDVDGAAYRVGRCRGNQRR